MRIALIGLFVMVSGCLGGTETGNVPEDPTDDGDPVAADTPMPPQAAPRVAFINGTIEAEGRCYTWARDGTGTNAWQPVDEALWHRAYAITLTPTVFGPTTPLDADNVCIRWLRGEQVVYGEEGLEGHIPGNVDFVAVWAELDWQTTFSFRIE